jgi:hypothetical protein
MRCFHLSLTHLYQCQLESPYNPESCECRSWMSLRQRNSTFSENTVSLWSDINEPNVVSMHHFFFGRCASGMGGGENKIETIEPLISYLQASDLCQPWKCEDHIVSNLTKTHPSENVGPQCIEYKLWRPKWGNDDLVHWGYCIFYRWQVCKVLSKRLLPCVPYTRFIGLCKNALYFLSRHSI